MNPATYQDHIQGILIMVVNLSRVLSNKCRRALTNLVLSPIIQVDQENSGIEVSRVGGQPEYFHVRQKLLCGRPKIVDRREGLILQVDFPKLA